MEHKVLIVDDDPQQRRYLSAILSSLGYGVATASGGIAAVEQLGAARKLGISLAHCCEAWNKLTDQPGRIMSIGMRDWAHGC